MTSAVEPTVYTQQDLPDYHLIELLYQGTQTTVYRAVDLKTQQPVVIKLLSQEYPSFSQLVQFRNQYTATRNLPITGIVHSLRLEPCGNSYCLVMEDVGGISLEDYLQDHWPSVSDVLDIAIQLAIILQDLHHHRVIHKDIKPANILIHPDSKQIKLIDFSIASLLPKETQTLQSPNHLEGSLAYLAPEQTGRMNRAIDYRTDFYALGVTLYQLLAQQLPFTSEDPLELIHCHIAQVPIAVNHVNPDVPAIVAAIVAKLMAKNAEDRYQNALGLKHDLQQCLTQWTSQGAISEFTLGQKDVSDRFIIPEKLYGRDVEVQALLTAFDRVSQGASELMMVAGFSGIGKTAVVNEVHKPITRQKGYFIKGKFDQFNRNVPFSAVVQAFRGLMGLLLGESDDQLVQWKTQILKAVGQSGQVLIEVIPELEHILGAQPPIPELVGSAAQNRFNLLLSQFIQVFTTQEHPLVIFLDDLQWADPGSLNLLKIWMGKASTGYLLILGAYRDNEVFPAHPLMLTLKDLENQPAKIHTLTLNPLHQQDLTQLVAHTMGCSAEDAAPLAELIQQKTKGNPFFSLQFLQGLQEDGHITLAQSGHWQYDVVQVKQLALTDDVVTFMVQRLQQFSQTTQTVLKQAACIGNRFDLATVAAVCEASHEDVSTALWPALQMGLVVPEGDAYKLFHGTEHNTTAVGDVTVIYRFLHDRVQQAVYSLIPDQDKQNTHFRIGQLLMENLSVEQREEKFFEIVNQLNFGLSFITVPHERETLARLNLDAGKKAKASTAYRAASKYLSSARTLLGERGWHDHYPLMLEIHKESVEAAYLDTDFQASEQLVHEAFQHTKTLLDQIPIYVIQIQSHIVQTRLKAAIHLALEVLRQLDPTIDLPESPDQEDFKRALQETQANLAHRTIEDLVHLPKMSDPKQLAAMQVLSSVAPPCYLSFPEMLPLIAMQMVNISLIHGNAPSSAFSYAMYGFLLCGMVNDIPTGYRFGQLSLALVEQLNAKAIQSKILLLASHFIHLWHDSIHHCIQLSIQGYRCGLESGDVEFAGYSASFYCYDSIFIGVDLETLIDEIQAYRDVVLQQKQEHIVNQISMSQQVVLNLVGRSPQPHQLRGDTYDEHQMIPQQQQADDRTGLAMTYVAKLMLCYSFEDYDGAIDVVPNAKKYLDGVVAMFCSALFCFYESLAKLAKISHVDEQTRQERLNQVKQNQAQMRYWADHAPTNYLHKFYLVEAEYERVTGNKVAALDYYEQAIATARTHQYLQEEALANERAAKFCLDWGQKKVATVYMQDAYYGYSRWGAKAKVADLENRYPDLLRPILQPSMSVNYVPPRLGAKSSSSGSAQVGLAQISSAQIGSAQVGPAQISSAQIGPAQIDSVHANSHKRSRHISHIGHNQTFDFASVLKATQTLSREIEMDRLLNILLHTVMENAGADKGILLMPHDSNWFVEAVATLEHPAQVQPIALSHFDNIPKSLIHTVSHRLVPMVIANASTQLPWATDVYILDHQPKSLLCTPIVQRGKLIAILYLENRGVVDAFTRDRVETVTLLTSQAAISLENARLYQKVEAYSHTLEAEVEGKTQALNQKNQELEKTLQHLQQTQAQFIHAEKMSSLGQMVAGIAHEFNNPVSFIKGNIVHLENYLEDMMDLLTLYQSEHPQVSPTIQTKQEEIDLDFIVHDSKDILRSMRTGSDRIRQIVLNLQNFAHLDQSPRKAVDLHSGIDSTLLIAQHRLNATGKCPPIHIIRNYGNLPLVSCYPSQINQVFLNILNNAIDAIRANPNCCDQPEIRIQSGVVDDQQVRVSIANTDSTIPQDLQNRIFDPFFTTKSVGHGTGLGLFVSYSIVQNHGGTLTVSSPSGLGTAFDITLPYKVPT